VLGRITAFSSEGKLSSPSGEEFNIRAVREQREIPDDLREDYLRYRVNIRVLGVLRCDAGGLTFVPSHRRLPHVGSRVAFPSGDVLRAIAGHNDPGVPIGYFALGEYVYAGRDVAKRSASLDIKPWMQFKEPDVLVKFPLTNLVARRSFVFARAGFGKSNLVKLLFSKLYETTPTVEKRAGRQVPVGSIIFDPDGEYFWPDDKGRPGLADVPVLRDKLVVFTDRHNPSPYYQSFVAGGIKLDIRRLKPADVIAIALAPDRQDQQNVRKLAGLPESRWEQLVDLIYQHRNQANTDTIAEILDLDASKQEMEALAAKSNMTRIVSMLHDPSSQLMDMLLAALAEGKLCVVDVSQMRGGQALVLSGLILRKIFDHNQEEFTKADSRTIPTIAVIEEAQSVLNERATSAEPFITWVKEGRKYDLGSVMITQQPGSIPTEILSQGDNWFIFHLLSSADLMNVKRANSHFSEDLLSVLLNEPIAGQGVCWSSVQGTIYPLSVRVFSFETMNPAVDSDTYSAAAADTFAARIRARFDDELERVQIPVTIRANGRSTPGTPAPTPPGLFDEFEPGIEVDGAPRVDVKATYEHAAIEALRSDRATLSKVETGAGIAWGSIKAVLSKLPGTLLDNERDDLAYRLVGKALSQIYGRQDEGWHTFKNPGGTTYVRSGRKSPA
jgi:DNA helicase HerA-like ATPase